MKNEKINELPFVEIYNNIIYTGNETKKATK